MSSAAQADLLAEAAESLGLPLERESLERLLAYAQLLQRWSRTYNLTAVRELDQILTHHLIDCLAVVNPLRRVLRSDATPTTPRVLDVGSGGGLPGVVLAIVGPMWQVTCVDAVGKKAAFIRQVQLELELPNLSSLHARVEQLPRPGSFDVVVSRAFSSLADFVTCTRGLTTAQGCWVAMKGRRPDEELASVGVDVEVFHVERLDVPRLDGERHLVWMRPLS